MNLIFTPHATTIGNLGYLLKTISFEKQNIEIAVPPNTSFVVIDDCGSLFAFNHQPLLVCGYYQPQPFHQTPRYLGCLSDYTRYDNGEEHLIPIE